MGSPTVDEVWGDPDFQGLPPEEKHKVLTQLDPDFAGLPAEEQAKVVGLKTSATTASDPKFYELEKQPGLPRSPLAFVKQVASNMAEGMSSPIPGGEFRGAVKTVQQLGQQLGNDVARGASTPGGILPDVGTNWARLLGFGTSVAADPTTYIGAGAGSKAANTATKSLISETAPTVLKVLADVPEEATNILLRTKDLFKKATGSEVAIEGAVRNVQTAMTSTLKREGAELGKVEETLGIAKTAQQKILEMAQGRDMGGYISKLGNMKPEELLGEYVGLKATNKMIEPTERLGQLVELKRALNDRINTFGQVGNSTQGLLKTAAKDIDRIVKETPGGDAIRSVQAKYARTRTLYNSLQTLLKDPNQAEQILENVFKSTAPRYKTIRRGLAELEKISGQPVLTKLFQEFAVKALNKTVSKGGRASLGAGISLSGMGMLPFHPVAGLAQLATGSTLMASQSPKILSQAVLKGAGAMKLPGAVVGAGVANTKVDINKIRQFLLNSSRQPGR